MSASRIGAGSLWAVATAALSEASAVSRFGIAKLDQADAPSPAAPEPAVPKPAAPEPAVPKPAAPEPAVPKPDAPEPDAPEPGVPAPDTPEADRPALGAVDVAGLSPVKSAKPGLADMSGVVNARTGAGVIGPDAGVSGAGGSPDASARSPAR
ncbi:hypothetical protein [Catenuloplanes japonicus]|uniref:hypothetical protein n=1 Tax=Catenuloplanes japonicus TaxID=33876 RepID=UPI0005243322|nr:hypothetical protein [Catenuloplanes japonicus]